jgi:Integrase core domain
MGQFDRDTTAGPAVALTGVGVEVEGNEQGRLGACGKRLSREPSFPGAERGTGDPLTSGELGDRQAAGELSVEALPPGVCEVEVLGSCHELAPGLEKRDQPSSIAAMARLDLSCAYFVERLWRSVKYEDIYIKDYELVPELESGLAAYCWFYDEERPHQALGYRTPAEVYRARAGGG